MTNPVQNPLDPDTDDNGSFAREAVDPETGMPLDIETAPPATAEIGAEPGAGRDALPTEPAPSAPVADTAETQAATMPDAPRTLPDSAAASDVKPEAAEPEPVPAEATPVTAPPQPVSPKPTTPAPELTGEELPASKPTAEDPIAPVAPVAVAQTQAAHAPQTAKPSEPVEPARPVTKPTEPAVDAPKTAVPAPAESATDGTGSPAASMPEAVDRLVRFAEQQKGKPQDARTLEFNVDGEASSPDGTVTATVHDDKLSALHIDERFLREGNPADVERAIIATVNEAREQFQTKAMESLKKATGGGIEQMLGDLQRLREDMQHTYKQEIDRIP